MIRSIRLYTVPQDQMRYNTLGDWFERQGETHVVASNLEDQKMEFLILFHELVEMVLCRHAGITQEEVDAFDKNHEAEQEVVELGDMEISPYRKQHCIATGLERIMAAELGVPWDEYESRLVEQLRK